MKNNKGFTLVEILSVLIILGIISLIVYPQANKVIEKNKEKATKEDINKLIESLDMFFAANDYKSDGEIYDVSTGEVNTLVNSSWEGGYVSYDDGKIILEQMYNGDVCLNGTDKDFTITNGSCKTTPVQCFEFVEETNTIVDYSSNKSCLKDVVIPNKINNIAVTTIGEKAFSNKGITSVSFPSTIADIEYSAFSYNKIKNIIIPDGMEVVNKSAFLENELTSITLPSSLTTIKEYAFARNKLKTINIPDSVRTIYDYAFQKNELTSLDLPEGIYDIRYNAFEYNNIKTLVLPNNLRYLYGDVFANNELTSLTLSNKLDSIYKSTFENNKLKTVVIPDSVKRIDYYAFYNNELTSVTLPSTLTKIEFSAFAKNNLKSITLPSTLATIEHDCFTENPLETISMPGRTSNNLGTNWYDGTPEFNF